MALSAALGFEALAKQNPGSTSFTYNNLYTQEETESVLVPDTRQVPPKPKKKVVKKPVKKRVRR